jgi:hypothetical protein
LWSGLPAESPDSRAGRSRIVTLVHGALSKESPRRRFDHAQSVNVRPRPTLRGGHSCCEPRHCGFGSGASRPSLLFLMNNARSKSNRSSRGFQDPAEVLCVSISRPLSRDAATTFKKRFSVYELRYAATRPFVARPCVRTPPPVPDCVTGRSLRLCAWPTLYNPRA